MFEWIKVLFSKAVRIFNSFLKEVFNTGLKVVLAALYDIALESCKNLMETDLTSEEKRNQAFNEIKDYAKSKGLSVSSHLINLLIEMCVTYLKKLSV